MSVDHLNAEQRGENTMSSVHGTTTKCLVTGEPCPPGVDDENYLQNCCWFNYDCKFFTRIVARRRSLRHPVSATDRYLAITGSAI